MGTVQDFEGQLNERSAGTYAKWHKVDLHNHSPASHDYTGNIDDAVSASAQALRDKDVSIAMFTDHEKLPSRDFAEAVSKQSGKIVLRGVELNIFVDAWLKPTEKIDKQPFFHLLVGFDPQNEYDADYWLNTIYQKCGREEKSLGSHMVRGVKNGVQSVADALQGSGAILIPAHLHSTSDAFKTRSIDDIYADPAFLALLPLFNALEVTKSATAAFFDGQHSETSFRQISCIRSSDAHVAGPLGTRPTWIQMQTPSFTELRASLELRSRVALVEPARPNA